LVKSLGLLDPSQMIKFHDQKSNKDNSYKHNEKW